MEQLSLYSTQFLSGIKVIPSKVLQIEEYLTLKTVKLQIYFTLC